MINNPGASRTLDPQGRSFVSLVGLHDRRLADSDVNLIQAVQDFKRRQLLKDHVCSGALTYAPFTFTARTASPVALQFTIPAFDALINGDIVTIGGANSADLTKNVVTLPNPVFWSPGSSAPQASIFAIYLEFWYQGLDATAGTGYFVDTNGGFFIYPNGCVNANSSNLIQNDVVDPFSKAKTTDRIQLQWALRVVRIDNAYDFTTHAFGLELGTNTVLSAYGQGGQAQPQSTSSFQFTNLGPITGDAGLWRAGDGQTNDMQTLDGYSYALPVAVAFQRNTGAYSANLNPFGTTDVQVTPSGTIASGWTARYDGKYADAVFAEDVVDTRSVVSLEGWDNSRLIREGFVDLISGKTRAALARGETPGNLPIATGSLLDYTLTVAPNSVANTNTVGAFDGFRNGFSSAAQTFYSTQAITVSQKTVGTVGARWAMGDSLTLSLPSNSPATIEYVQVQTLVDNTVDSTKTPVLLLNGQVSITGAGTKSVTISIMKDLTGTAYDPGLNSMFLTVGVQYPANSGMDLVKVPNKVYGGTLTDSVTGKTIPVYGVSDYAVSASLPVVASGVAVVYSPNYSNLIFGTRVSVAVASTTGTTANDASGNPVTTFTIGRTALPGRLTGLYAVSAADSVTGAAYAIVGRTISGTNFILKIQGTVKNASTVNVTFLAADTAQLSYNAPVKAVSSIEQTVIAGTVSNPLFRTDPRVSVVSVKNYGGAYNVVVLGVTGTQLTGISGDDVNKLIWVRNTAGTFDAVQVAGVTFSNGFVTLNVPGTVNLEVQSFMVIAAINPAFGSSSSLTLTQNYVPYQGEGSTAHDYELVHVEDSALITTNGTGTAPVPGLKDIYPYDRDRPIASALPSQVLWSDATLLNQPVAGFFDSNFVAKVNQNIEHTFEVPVHSNDFVEPIADGKRKSFKLSVASGGRGFAKASPHMGFAIAPINPKTAQGVGVTTTSGAITLFVNNVSGSDTNDGLAITAPFQTINAALKSLPSILKHPVSLQLVPTGQAYSTASLRSQLPFVALGDGVVRASKYYALGILTHTIQDSGRLVITALAGASASVVMDGSGFTAFGDGPTSAFFVENSRVIFNQITFSNFSDPAVKGVNANVEFIDCVFSNNTQMASFEQGSSVILDGCYLSHGPNSLAGFVMEHSDMSVTGGNLSVVNNTGAGAFFVAERSSNLTLDAHDTTAEVGITSSTLVAQAELMSTMVATSGFKTAGTAALSQNSVLLRSAASTPFNSVSVDASSSISTNV